MGMKHSLAGLVFTQPLQLHSVGDWGMGACLVKQAQASASNEAIWLRPLPLASCKACSLRRTRS